MDNRIKNNTASDEKASKTRRELLLGGVSLAASPFLAACGDGITEANGIVKADASTNSLVKADALTVGDNPTTASLSIDGQPDSPNSETTKSFEQLSSETTPYTQVLPVAGVYHVEVVFKTLKAAEIFLSDNVGTHIKIATKGVTAHESHKVHFALWNINATAIKTSKLKIGIDVKGSNDPRYITSDTQSTPNMFLDVCWARRTYDDSHDGQLEYEWVFYNGIQTTPVCFVRFYRIISYATPAGVTVVNNRVGHNHLFGETVTMPRHLGGLIDPKTVTLKAVRGDVTSDAVPRTDTVVAPNRRSPGHSELLATLDSAESGLERDALRRTYQRRMVQSAHDLRESKSAPILEENNPDAYVHLSNQFLSAIGGHKVTDALTEAISQVQIFVDKAFDSTAKAMWELGKEVIPEVFHAEGTARRLQEKANNSTIKLATTVTGGVSVQGQLAVTLWNVGYLRGVGGRVTWHLANYTRELSTGVTSNYSKSKDLSALATFTFILKGPETKYTGVIGKISTDLHVSVTVRYTEAGSRWRVENFTVDLKTELDIADWVKNTFDRCVRWFQAPTRYQKLAGPVLPDPIYLDDIQEIDYAGRTQDIFDNMSGWTPSNTWDPLAPPTSFLKTLEEIEDKQNIPNAIKQTIRNWNYFEISILKFVFPNGEVASDPNNTKTPYSANFMYVGTVWMPGFRMNNGTGYEFTYQRLTAKVQVYVRVIGTADISSYYTANNIALTALKVNWASA